MTLSHVAAERRPARRAGSYLPGVHVSSPVKYISIVHSLKCIIVTLFYALSVGRKPYRIKPLIL
jgi:hypothetical protein